MGDVLTYQTAAPGAFRAAWDNMGHHRVGIPWLESSLQVNFPIVSTPGNPDLAAVP